MRVAVSGGFDPFHIGHLDMFNKAKYFENRDNRLVVILNTDDFLIKKKGFIFMPLCARKTILESIKYVDYVFPSIDEDMTVCKSLECLAPDVFINSGDKDSKEKIPEVNICDKLGIRVEFVKSSFLIHGTNIIKSLIQQKAL